VVEATRHVQAGFASHAAMAVERRTLERRTLCN
jgi:hypothetical protein